MLRLGVLSVAAVAALAADGPPAADLQRAKTKKPRDEFKGSDQTELSRVLNTHLLRAEARTRPCQEWSPKELQHFMADVVSQRHESFQEIYHATSDRRRLLLRNAEEYREKWADLNGAVAQHPHLLEPLRESHCREAVMWWTHHLTDEGRAKVRARNHSVPLLPESPKRKCGSGSGGETEQRACVGINEPNSCDWCHSTQAAHDAGVPGTTAPDALKKTSGPDDGNPHGWDRKRRCDQDQMPRCQLCEGIGGRAWSDKNEDIDLTPCEIVAKAEDVNKSTVAPPLYPKAFTVRRKDGQQGGYSDTLIGWKTDPFCLGFFPQNDSIKPLCYRSQDSTVKYYDISREAARTDYIVPVPWKHMPNITSTIIQKDDTMWVQNHMYVVDQCICTNPSGNHCNNPPCKAYVWHWNTFENAQYLGREKIGVEWIQHHGTGKSAKIMELDHFILWAHHVWTDPVSRRPVRMWKPFNGLQNYDPEAWTDSVEDPDAVFDAPPKKCKKGGARIRIHCDDDGHYQPGASEGLELLEELHSLFKKVEEEGLTYSEFLALRSPALREQDEIII